MHYDDGVSGTNNSLLARAALRLFSRQSTIATAKVSSQFKNIVLLAAASHPDPEFLESILAPLPIEEARALVRSYGVANEIPLCMSILRQFYHLSEVLVKYGADVEQEGNMPQNRPDFGRSPLGVVINFHNHSSHRAVSWLLEHDASLIVNKHFGLSAYDVAVMAGGLHEMSSDDPQSVLPLRVYQQDTRVLKILLEKHRNSDLINRISDSWGWTTLHWAIFRLNPRAVELLLKAGADPDIQADPPKKRQATARELIEALDETDIPAAVTARGQQEVSRYWQRIQEVKAKFHENAKPRSL